MELPMAAAVSATYGTLAEAFDLLATTGDDTIGAVHEKEMRYQGLVVSDSYRRARRLADAWCAAFVWRKTLDAPAPVTEDVLLRLAQDPPRVGEDTLAEIDRLAADYRFLHWHLVFPDVFAMPKPGEEPSSRVAGWMGGFDVVLGNPPWERVKLQEKEWFALRRPDIAAAANAAARRKRIAALKDEDPKLSTAWEEALREADGESHLIRNSGRFPLCGRGDINTYSIFAETNRLVLGSTGRVGCILPTGIATDDTTKFFFGDLVESKSLVSLYGFENEEFIFPAVHHATKFCLLTVAGGERPQDAADFVFFARQVADLADRHRHFSLTREDIALLNPNTRTCPIFRSQRDAELTKAIYRRVPVLIKEGPPEENPWVVRFLAMFHMANDSGLFRTRAQLEGDGWRLDGNVFRRDDQAYLPLYEAKMVHHFDDRFGTYEGQTEAQANQGKLPEATSLQHADPYFVTLPEYWVPAGAVDEALADRWDRHWHLGWRDICRATDQRTVIASLVPRTAVGHTFPLILFSDPSAASAGLLLANMTSLVFDYVARQKIGGTHLTFTVLEQLTVVPARIYEAKAPWNPSDTVGNWLVPRNLELAYTAWNMESFARDCGHDGPPFRWDDERRFLLRCELDAAFFHLYGTARDDVDYILETFPIVKREDVKQHGEYRTKRTILEIYDAMQRSMATGHPYRTRLDPPPADPRLAHSAPVITDRPTGRHDA
jgi:hypothetical protein